MPAPRIPNPPFMPKNQLFATICVTTYNLITLHSSKFEEKHIWSTVIKPLAMYPLNAMLLNEPTIRF